MRTMINRDKFWQSMIQTMMDRGIDVHRFIESPECKAMMDAILEQPEEECYYSVDDMDYCMKINLRLINKFKDQLNEEYGSDMISIMKMMKTLYEEQNKETPMRWYEMGLGKE